MLPQGWLQNHRPLGQVGFLALEQISAWNVGESREDKYRYHLPADTLSKVARIGVVLESRRSGKGWKQRGWEPPTTWEPVLLSVSCRSCNCFQGGLCILAGALIAEYLLQM